MFSIGDKIVHPMHGAGIIQNIVQKKVDGVLVDYYALKLTLGDVVIFVPVSHSEAIGMRAVCSEETAQKILHEFPKITQDEDKCWNRRYRENMLRIRSGDIGEVSKVVKNLLIRNLDRGLSTGEKKMLNSAKQILVSELTLALGTSCQHIEHVIDTQLCP